MKLKKINIMVKDIRRVGCFIPICLEHVLTLYETQYHYDISKAYVVAWEFGLNENINIENKKMSDFLCITYSLFTSLEQFCGIKIIQKEVFTVKQLLNVIEKNIREGYPTLIHLDTYFSEWGMLYLKEHSDHVGVANGIDYENKMLLITDPDYSYESFSIDISLLNETTKFYLDIYQANVSKYSYTNLLSYIREERDSYIKMFHNLESFVAYFRSYFNPYVEFTNPNSIDSVLDSVLILKLREVVKGRNLFIVFLEHLVDENSYVKKAMEYLQISMGKWNTIMNLLFKSSRTLWKSDFNEKIYNILISIADIERRAYNVLYFGENEQKVFPENKDTLLDVQKYRVVQIPLEKMCNNKGFVYGNWDEGADLTSAGEYFVLNENQKYIYYKGIPFQMYFGNSMDNVVCKEQKIKITLGNAIQGIAFLLCAEWGASEDAVIINDQNGFSDVYKIVANDISQINAKGVIELGYSKLSTGEIMNEKAGITFGMVRFKDYKLVESVVLPDNPNLHLLSMVVLI